MSTEATNTGATAGGATDYKKYLYGGNTDIVNNPVDCLNADLSSSHSATLEFKKISCEKNVVINVDHSATLVIDTLECASATINVSYSSRLHIGDLKCSGNVNIHNSYSSTLLIDKGEIDRVEGLVEYSSLGKCYAKIKRDDVRVETASTWRT
jgi:hypothetical protein